MSLYSRFSGHAYLTARFTQLSGYTALSGGQTASSPDRGIGMIVFGYLKSMLFTGKRGQIWQCVDQGLFLFIVGVGGEVAQ